MATKQIQSEYAIDAAGKTLGRVASEAAKALEGKMRADYTPHIRSLVLVTISNASKMFVTERKRQAKLYSTYSGHPGGLKQESMASLIGRRGHDEALRRAVQKMLPRNTMLVGRMKKLTIID